MKSQFQPAYMRIRQYLIQRIYAGDIGDKILSESELCDIFCVTHPTVRAALKELVEAGELTARKGVGVFIARKAFGAAEETAGIITGDGRHAYHSSLEALILSGVLSEFSKHRYSATFLSRSESIEKFPAAVKSLGVKGVVWVFPNYELLKLFRRVCPDIKISVAAACPFFSRHTPPPEKDIADGGALWDVYEETLRIGRHFFSSGMRKIVWIVKKQSSDDFDSYLRGFSSAAEERGIDLNKALIWMRLDKISGRQFREIFSDGPAGIYAHERFIPDLARYAGKNGLIFGEDYRLLKRDSYACAQDAKIKTDVSLFDNQDIGARAARALVSLLSGQAGEATKIKVPPIIISTVKGAQL